MEPYSPIGEHGLHAWPGSRTESEEESGVRVPVELEFADNDDFPMCRGLELGREGVGTSYGAVQGSQHGLAQVSVGGHLQCLIKTLH